MHSPCGQHYDWSILWACKHWERAVEYASALEDRSKTTRCVNECFFRARVKPRDQVRGMTRVWVDKVPYFPGLRFHPEASAEKYVLYRYSDSDLPWAANIEVLGAYSSLEDAVLEGSKLGDGKSTQSRYCFTSGSHFDQGDLKDEMSRIGVDKVAFDLQRDRLNR